MMLQFLKFRLFYHCFVIFLRYFVISLRQNLLALVTLATCLATISVESFERFLESRDQYEWNVSGINTLTATLLIYELLTIVKIRAFNNR